MPISPSYPGIYIEELPSSAHTVTAAPTSITVFVGYSHPYLTRAFNTPVRIFSFSDYERAFGGLFASGEFSRDLPYSVDQFFLNGGSDAYVYGLKPQYLDATNALIAGGTDSADPFFPEAPTRPKLVVANGGAAAVVFRALQPTDTIPLRVSIDPRPSAPSATADIVITYGSRVESYRNVSLDSVAGGANFIEDRINGFRGTGFPSGGFRSGLVTVEPDPSGYPTQFPKVNALPLPAPTPAGFATTRNPADYAPAFATDGPLDKVAIFNLMALPGVSDNGVLSDALAFCEKKLAFLVMDPPYQAPADEQSPPLKPISDPAVYDLIPKSPNGALYFPYLRSLDPLTGAPIELPPSGYVAGVYARTDSAVGVWKAPAGYATTLLNTTGVVPRGRMSDPRQGVLNLKAINCLRDFPGVGTIVFGARTLVGSRENTAQEQNRYVPVRRMTLFIEQSLKMALTWVIFQPNDTPLWTAIRMSVEGFMLGLFRQGALQGRTSDQAFQVKCDAETTRPEDVANGIVNIVVAFAPLRPAEFVVLKIAQLAGQAQA